jgi:hypothetical protein
VQDQQRQHRPLADRPECHRHPTARSGHRSQDGEPELGSAAAVATLVWPVWPVAHAPSPLPAGCPEMAGHPAVGSAQRPELSRLVGQAATDATTAGLQRRRLPRSCRCHTPWSGLGYQRVVSERLAPNITASGTVAASQFGDREGRIHEGSSHSQPWSPRCSGSLTGLGASSAIRTPEEGKSMIRRVKNTAAVILAVAGMAFAVVAGSSSRHREWPPLPRNSL